MSNVKAKECSVCNEEITKFDSAKQGIIEYRDNKGICQDCAGEGWTICSICIEPFNKNEVNPEGFHMNFQSSIDLKDVRLPERRFIGSNKCYNLAYVESILNSLNKPILEIEILELHNDRPEEERKLILEINRKNIEYFTEIKNQLS